MPCAEPWSQGGGWEVDHISEDLRLGRPGSGKGPEPLGKRDQKTSKKQKTLFPKLNLGNIECVWCIYFGFVSLLSHFEAAYQMEPNGTIQ